MKILFVVFHFPPISGGGVIVAVDMANTLAKLGHNVTVITPDIEWDGPKYEPKIESKVEIIRVEVPSKSKIKVAARRCKKNLQAKAEEFGRKEKFDFVLTIFHPFHLAPSAAVSCAKTLEIPSIVKIDDAVYEKTSGFKSIQRKIENMINTKTLQNASHILVMNEHTKQIVVNSYDVLEKNISIVPNGIDLSIFQDQNSSDSKTIIFSGAMYHHRGLDVLLEAAPKVIEKIPDVKFILLGDGPEIEKLKKIVKEKNISENVVFKGWIEREKVPAELSQATVGIGPLKLTTVTENALPIKVLEYMAAGLPVIAKIGTLPKEVLENEKNGFFVDEPLDLAEKIVTILENEEKRRKMSEESIKMIEKFSWEKIVTRILDIQKSL